MNSDSENVIYTECLTKKFGAFTAVDSISFKIRRGEIFGFLGANGAGKTTAMKMLAGILKPTSGKASVAGYDIYRQQEKIKRRIGYMSQKFSLYESLTIKENLEFYGGIYGIPKKELGKKIEEIVRDFEFENEIGLVKSLPLGWKQKIAFAAAMIHEPDIVFLDEPTGGVGPDIRRQFWEMIYKASDSGSTFFVTTHYMDEAEYCGRISIMVDGRIEELDTPANLKKKHGADSINDVFVKLARPEKNKNRQG